MSPANGAQFTKKPADPRRRLPIFLAIVAVVALGLAYYAAVKRNTVYMVGRDTRLLSAAARQIDGTISSQRGLVRNFALADMWSDGNGKPLLHYERRALGNTPLARYFGDLDSLERAPQTGKPPAADEFTKTLIAKNDQLMVELTYRAANKSSTPGPNEFPMQGDGPPSATGRLSLDKVVERVFASTLMASFDSVLLARENGTVLYQVQPAAAVRRAGQTRTANPAPPSVVLTSLASLREESAFRGETPISLELLRTQSRRTDVALGGSSYVLISQPYAFDIPFSGEGAKEKSGSWILCGLVTKSRFRHEATALSPSTLAAGTGAFFLLLCCGPFLKLALLGGQQPLRRLDVILLTMATLLGGSIVALFVIDSLAYQRLDDIADDEQRAYAGNVTATLRADINRGLKVADELMLVTAKGDGPRKGSSDNLAATDADCLPQSALYPWASSFAWIDKAGNQYSRGEMGAGRPPMVRVSRREYFVRVLSQPLIWHGEGSGVGRAMYIDSTRSLTTGKPETVFAVPTGRPAQPVFSVLMPFLQFASPVAPPGMSFAVIDDDGNVLYHEDEQRILIENVFTETDNDRALRAIVFSRREEMLDAPYWGRDQRILVTPLRDLPWTLLTFRDRSLLRATNLEALVVTSVLLALYFAILAAIFIALAVLWPGYRARWLWPGEHRAAAWRRLAWLLGVSIVALAIALVCFSPGDRLAASLLFPLQASLAAYLILDAAAKRPGYAVVGAVWGVITLVVIARLVAGPFETELVSIRMEWVLRAVMLLCTAAGVALTAWPHAPGSVATWTSYARRYVVSGVLAVIVLAMLPAAGFFQTAFAIEVESMMKYGQLMLADELRHRLETAAGRTWRPTLDKSEALPEPNGAFFQSRWSVDAPPAVSGLTASNEVAELLEPLLPQYSDESTAMRDLHHGEASDGRWSWTQRGRVLELARPLTISEEARRKLQLPEEQVLVIASRVPWLIPGALASARDDEDMPLAVRAVALLLVVTLLLAIVRAAIRFLARKVFLYDLAGAPRRLSQWPVKPRAGEHLFIVHAERKIEELVDMAGVKEIALAAPGDWAAEVADNRRLLIRFGDWTDGAEALAMRLHFLEELLRLPDRNVIVASNMAPMVVLSRAGEDAARWSGVLTSFIYVNERHLPGGAARAGCVSFMRAVAQALGLGADRTKLDSWLAEEADGHPLLEEIRKELQNEDAGREQLIDEFCERAGAYYAVLWSACSAEEHVVLDQLARNGYVNADNRLLLRRLLNRGLVVRDPAIRLFNESFRRFVLSRPPAEVQMPEGEKVESAWDRLRVPLFVLMIAVAAFFLSTQKELMNATSAIITGLTAGLPALMKLGSVLSSRRSSAPAGAE